MTRRELMKEMTEVLSYINNTIQTFDSDINCIRTPPIHRCILDITVSIVTHYLVSAERNKYTVRKNAE